jgi:hypothetical protein
VKHYRLPVTHHSPLTQMQTLSSASCSQTPSLRLLHLTIRIQSNVWNLSIISCPAVCVGCVAQKPPPLPSSSLSLCQCTLTQIRCVLEMGAADVFSDDGLRWELKIFNSFSPWNNVYALSVNFCSPPSRPFCNAEDDKICQYRYSIEFFLPTYVSEGSFCQNTQ